MNIKYLEKRIRSIELARPNKEDLELNRSLNGDIAQAVAKYGPMPEDLQADIEPRPEQEPGNIISDPVFLEAANRLARWLACGNQWGKKCL